MRQGETAPLSRPFIPGPGGELPNLVLSWSAGKKPPLDQVCSHCGRGSTHSPRVIPSTFATPNQSSPGSLVSRLRRHPFSAMPILIREMQQSFLPSTRDALPKHCDRATAREDLAKTHHGGAKLGETVALGSRSTGGATEEREEHRYIRIERIPPRRGPVSRCRAGRDSP